MGTLETSAAVGDAAVGAMVAQVAESDVGLGGGTAFPPAGVLLAPLQRSRVVTLVSEHISQLVVCGAMLAWSAWVFSIVRSDFANFKLARFDLGNMVQAVWSTAHGRSLEVTSPSGEQISRLGLHVDPILALLSPLWLIWPSPLSLAFVQIAAVALGALPVFWLARRHLDSEPLACMLALAYLSYPWLAWTAADAMHPVTLAIPLFLYAIWFLDGGRAWAAAPFLILAALTGELMGIPVAGLGVWYMLAHRRLAAGAAIAALGATWSAFAVEVVIPHFLGGSSVYYSRYDAVGGSPAGLAKMAFRDPGAIVSALLTRDDAVYWLLLGAPLLGLFLLAPGLAAVAIPQLMVNGLSDRPAMVNPAAHYIAALFPFLFAGAVIGIARLSRPVRTGCVVALVTLSVGVLLVAHVRPMTGIGSSRQLTRAATPEHLQALRDGVALVPGDAPVTSTNSVGARLAARRFAYTVPVVRRAQWVVLDIWNPWMSGSDGRTIYPERLASFRARMEHDPSWRNVYERDGVLVFRKTAA